MKRLARFFGTVLLFLLGAVVCTVLALFVLAAFCITYPVLRLSPKDARLKAVIDLVMAGAAVAAAFKTDPGQAVEAVLGSVREQDTDEQEAHDGDPRDL